MKTLLSFISLLLLSTSIVTTECANSQIRALRYIIPINAAVGYLGFKFIQWSKQDKIKAQNILDYPEKNLTAIEDFCKNYTMTIYTGRHWISVPDNSLLIKYFNVKDKPEELKKFALEVKNAMNSKANGNIFLGYLLPIFSLIGSAGHLASLNK